VEFLHDLQAALGAPGGSSQLEQLFGQAMQVSLVEFLKKSERQLKHSIT
jgi:hypothetical protein